MNTHFINFFSLKFLIFNYHLCRSKQKVLIKDNKNDKVHYDETKVTRTLFMFDTDLNVKSS